MRRLLLLLAAAATVLLTGCGSPTSAPGSTSSQDVVAGEQKVESLAALLPEDVRKAGTVKVGSSIGTPPSAFYPDPATKKPAGVDIDITDGVAKVLGITVDRQEAAFESILPALGSGKFDVGTGNFGVTTARLKTIDFVTYIDDGEGFAVRKDDTAIQPVTDPTQLCGLTIGTGAGTTFETTLNSKKDVCAGAGKKPYEVKVFSENAAALTGLQQSRVDIIMSTINGLRYQAAQPASGTRFLGEFHRLDVGFAFKKGSPLAPAFQAAVNQLIKDGTYDRILQKWAVTGSAIQESRISPPEHP